MIDRKKKLTHVPINDELLKQLRTADEDGFIGSRNTMARRKCKRKIFKFDVLTKTEMEQVKDFDDLRVGDVFCLYEYNGEEVLCSGIKTLRVNSIIEAASGFKLDIQPFIIK